MSKPFDTWKVLPHGKSTEDAHGVPAPDGANDTAAPRLARLANPDTSHA